MLSDLYVAGAKVFVTNPKRGDSSSEWVVATVISRNGDDVSCEISAGGQKLRVMKKITQLPLCEKIQSSDSMADDFQFPSNPSIIENVKNRYAKGVIYTTAGDCLVSVNPYKVTTTDDKTNANIYDFHYMLKCRTRPSDAQLNTQTRAKSKVLRVPPHPFILADEAYESLRSNRQSQTIVIQGVGGTGKSENAKLMVNYLVNLKSLSESPPLPEPKKKRLPSGPLGMVENPFVLGPEITQFDKVLLAAISTIECFSSAKTSTNDNSSRVGKFLKIYFGSSFDVAGAHFSTYMLEKSRVTHQPPSERSFHIFYQLILGGKNALKVKHKLKTMIDYSYLNNVRMQGINDEIEFNRTLENMKLLGFTESDLDLIFSTLSAILELGNASFTGGDGNASIPPKSQESLKIVEELMSLPKGSLSSAILQKAIGTARGKTTTVEAKVEDAVAGRDGLAKTLYSKIFDFVISKINSTLATLSKGTMERAGHFGKTLNGNPLSVGIVESYGFESSAKNSFETLVINYIEEKIQQQVTQSMFKGQLSQYSKEQLDFSTIDFIDNQDVVDLLDKKPQGLLCMLDEACRYPRNTDKSFLQKLTSTHMRKSSATNRVFEKDKTKDDLTFTIKNTYEDTVYDCDGFLEKNKDRLGAHIAELFSSSSDKGLAEFFSDSSPSTEGVLTRSGASSSAAAASSTFAKKVKDDMDVICSEIVESTISLLRCIKPNSSRQPETVDIKLFENQLVKADIISSIRMRQDGFAYTSVFQGFYERFIIVIPTNTDPTLDLVPKPGCDYKKLCKTLLRELGKLAHISNLEATVQFGASSIFVKHRTYQAFEALRKVKFQDMDRAAVLLQATFRMGIKQKDHKSLKKGVSRAQASWRAVYYRNKYEQQKKAIAILQLQARGFVARKVYRENLHASKTIKSFYGKLKGRVRWRKLQNAVRSLHSLSRAYIVRMHVNRMLEAVQLLQDCARSFLRRNKIHYTRVRVALFIQGWVRGSLERSMMTEAVEYLANKRKERFRARAVKKAQNRWKSLMVRRRFKQLIQACKTLQQFARSHQQRGEFVAMKKAAIGLQSGFRGLKDRDRVREVRNEKMVEEEQQAVYNANRNEAQNLANLNARRAQGLAGGKSRNFRYDLLDVDILVAINDVYPEGWSKNVITLDNEVAKRGRRITNVLVGAAHTIALTDTGEIYSWGWSDCGQLGHGSHQQEKSPRALETLMLQAQTSDTIAIDRAITGKMSIKQVAVGEDHTLALADTGRVFSWGGGKKGQLGHGDFKNNSYPRCIQTLKWTTTSVVCGSNHSVSIGHNGSIYTWGAACAMGGVALTNANKIYQNAKGDISVPANMKDVLKTKIKRVCAGAKFTLGLTYDGDIYSWGDNSYGQLGEDRDTDKPKIIEGLKLRRRHHAGIVNMSCGARHSLAVNSSGQVLSWGWNEFGQLGSGDTHNLVGIHPVLGDLAGEPVTQVSAGFRHSAALTRDGDIFVWGMSALGARDGSGVPVIPTKEGLIAAGPAQKLNVVPLKIYRAGQNLTKAIELHSSWSRCTSGLNVTIRSKQAELPSNRDGSTDWNSYLLKKLNAILANGNRPEIDADLRDESREFVVRLVNPNGSAMSATSPTRSSTRSPVGSPVKPPSLTIGRQFSYTLSSPGGSKIKKSPNKASPTRSKFAAKSTVVSERELREYKANDLRTFAHQLKNGLVRVAPRIEEKQLRGGKTELTFGEQSQNFFRKQFRGIRGETDETLERENGWNSNYNRKDVSNADLVKRNFDITRELNRREAEKKRLEELSARKEQLPVELEEEKKKREAKMRLMEENKKRRKLEMMKLRKGKEGMKKIGDGEILDYFNVEHLVAASNDNYTPAQVRTIYGRSPSKDTGAIVMHSEQNSMVTLGATEVEADVADHEWGDDRVEEQDPATQDGSGGLGGFMKRM
eukprot:CAMPEP_0118638798 /NCGR_PEP_ID=MMETSP0785-20121206/3889_1 /TAXON_ID=91992 /ORGANISM="Bolidomonas pacifica, Strain CCMP 1866" /LENGTH=1915 /DNA_ID=CAMNT_0006530097 /DNA_START=150 /DNA_END=5894 /DNA_ORIENTATION=+